MRVQWHKAEPGHLPQKCQVPIKQLDGLEQCELGVSLKETNQFGNAQSLELLHIPTPSWFDWSKASKISYSRKQQQYDHICALNLGERTKATKLL